MDPTDVLARSRALWNRASLDLGSDEVLAQLLDRGSLDDWRAVFRLLEQDDGDARALQARIHQILLRVPTGRPFFWMAVLARVGFPVDWNAEPRHSDGEAEL